jgi:hypothetical protein
MPNKLIKISHKLSANIDLNKTSIPIHYHLGKSNFDDDMNLGLFLALLNKKTCFSNQCQLHILGW